MAEVFYATGRRKESIARAYVTKGKGNFLVNGKHIDEFFTTVLTRNSAKSPLILLNLLEKFDVKVFVKGGGTTGQSGAIKLAIARVLSKLSEENHKVLRAHDMLTRDPRAVERKHYGRAKARKGYQSSKR